MIVLRLPLIAAVLTSAVGAAEGEADRAALRLDMLAAKAPKPLAMEFRMRAAAALKERHAELADKFVEQTLSDLRGGKDWVVGYGVMQDLAKFTPTGAVSILPNLVPGYAQLVIGALAQSHYSSQAIVLYLDMLRRGEARASGSASILGPLAKEDPVKAAKLFQDVVATLPDPLDPSDAAWIANTPPPIGNADALERVLKNAAAPDYGSISSPVILGSFALGSRIVTTTKTRDTLLLVAAMRMKAIAPERLAKYQEVLSPWDLSGTVQMRSISYRASTPAAKPGETRAMENSINQRLGQIRGKATDTERAELVLQIARDIRSLPAGEGKISAIRNLASHATEGDLGKEALTAVASTMGDAIRESFPVMMEARRPAPYGDVWIELAKLLRYERVPAPFADPSLDAAGALLELRERVQQENGFTLQSLDGRTYTLESLKGRVVLLNFWATWCPPCRKEMPDMEKLYREYESKGLTVLAVSDEDRQTVEKYLQQNPYTFPVLLDPGRKVNTAFMIDGIPKSFLFDREGRLAAQAIDMRTEAQFRELLKQAGL
jgi:thiol-disulfide isomerase/thioredoxin